MSSAPFKLTLTLNAPGVFKGSSMMNNVFVLDVGCYVNWGLSTPVTSVVQPASTYLNPVPMYVITPHTSCGKTITIMGPPTTKTIRILGGSAEDGSSLITRIKTFFWVKIIRIITNCKCR
jgi:hypothetical protein